MKIIVPYPPSANRYWRVYRGIVCHGQDAKDFKRDVAVIGTVSRLRPFPGTVELQIRVYRPRKAGDLDNQLKVLIDALKGIAYVDDKQVKKIIAEQFDDKDDPRAEVTILEYATMTEATRKFATDLYAFLETENRKVRAIHITPDALETFEKGLEAQLSPAPISAVRIYGMRVVIDATLPEPGWKIEFAPEKEDCRE